MKTLSNDFINEVVNAKGMTSVKDLSRVTKVNRWTLSDVLNKRKNNVSDETYTRLYNFKQSKEEK
jgi:hypothetical protein